MNTKYAQYTLTSFSVLVAGIPIGTDLRRVLLHNRIGQHDLPRTIAGSTKFTHTSYALVNSWLENHGVHKLNIHYKHTSQSTESPVLGTCPVVSTGISLKHYTHPIPNRIRTSMA